MTQVSLQGWSFHGSELIPNGRGVSGFFQELSGWWEPSPSTGEVEQRAYASGGVPGRAFHQSRVLVFKGGFRGDDPVAVREEFEAFVGALPIDGLFPLVVEEGGLVRHVMARLEGDPLVSWRGGKTATLNLQFVAPMWRRLAGDGSNPSRSVTVGLPFTQGGRRRPYVLPSRIDGVAVSGLVELVNMGSAPPPVVVEFVGPVSRPSVRSEVTGRSQWFDLEVLAGQSLVVDQDARSVRLNGVSRRGAMRGEWLAPVPGDRLVFDAGSFVEAARMTVSWSDSWK